MIGKKLNIDNKEFTVTAIVDTHLDIERYASLSEEKEEQTNAEVIIDYVLYSEFSSAHDNSYAGVIMVGNGYIERLIKARKPLSRVTEGYMDISSDNCYVSTEYLAKLSDVKDQKIVWLSGAKETLAENEIIVSASGIGIHEMHEQYYNEIGEFDYTAYFKDNNELKKWVSYYNNNSEGVESKCKIVGYIPYNYESQTNFNAVVCDDSTVDSLSEGADKIYSFAVGAMPKEREELKSLVSFCYKEDTNIRYQIQNAITFELDSVNDFLVEGAKIFIYIGLGFALFAALMLSNFIAISISYKKQEIGILRAIGSRSNDVFRIFFSESFIIAMINFVLSAVGVFVVTKIINGVVRNELGILITVLSFTPRQIVLLLAVSIFVAFLASFFPVKKIASKKPIDAIRNR
jgi:ABC-type antimicrobial peptide transport system permease subunit